MRLNGKSATSGAPQGGVDRYRGADKWRPFPRLLVLRLGVGRKGVYSLRAAKKNLIDWYMRGLEGRSRSRGGRPLSGPMPKYGYLR